MAQDGPIEEYLTFLAEPQTQFHGQSRVENSIYTPRSTLLQYFNGGNSIEELLGAALQYEGHIADGQTILDEYLGTFTILLTIGHGQYLNRFVERDYSDEKLPLIDRPRHFPKTETGSFFDAFFDAQWRFCPVKLPKAPMNLQLEPEQILPVVTRTELSALGGTTITMVELHGEYDPFCSGQVPLMGNGFGQARREQSMEPNHRYIFKDFADTAKAGYDKELAAYLHLKKSGTLLGNTVADFYGSFVHEGSRTIILESADNGTLDEYMHTAIPPTKAEDIIRLWEAMLRLHEPLQTIHSMKSPHPPETSNYSMLRGWHGNINPQSISLYTKHLDRSDIQVRLSEIGVAAWDPTYMNLISSEDQASDDQMVDIWSLGCVYSEFAVWLVLGLGGLKDYRANRISEHSEPGLESNPAFHNGQQLLSCVREWHEQAVDSKRNSDRVTEQVLEQMVEEMLAEDADARPNAKQLKMKANKILNKAKEQIGGLNRGNSVASTTRPVPATSAYQYRQSQRFSMRSDDSQGTTTDTAPESLARMSSTSSATSDRSRRGNFTTGAPIEEEKEFVASSPQPLASPLSPLPASRRQTLKPGLTRATSTAQTWLKYQENQNRQQVTPATVINEVDEATTAMMNGNDMEAVFVRKPVPIRETRPPIPEADRPAPLRVPSRSSATSPDPPQAAPPATPSHQPTSHSHEVAAILESPTSQPPAEDLPEYTPFEIPLDIRPDSDPQGPTVVPTPSRSSVSQSNRASTSTTSPPPSLQRTGSLASQQSTSQRSAGNPPNAPYISLLDGLVWLNARKEKASFSNMPDSTCLDILADRDFMFIVDDSKPMLRHQDLASYAVRMMSWLLKKYDKSGIDLYFTQNQGKVHARPGHSSDLQRPIINTLASAHGRSNITIRVNQVLKEYLERAEKKRPSGFGRKNSVVAGNRKIMLYVITDCAWLATDGPGELRGLLETVGGKLMRQGAADGAVGLQIIRCMEDGAQEIEGLKMGNYQGKIVLDTHVLERNIFRNLIGSLSPLWKDEGVEEQIEPGVAM